MRINFGKFRGEKVEDLPTDYIEWCVENVDDVPSKRPLLDEMRNQLALRRGEGVQRQKGRLG